MQVKIFNENQFTQRKAYVSKQKDILVGFASSAYNKPI